MYQAHHGVSKGGAGHQTGVGHGHTGLLIPWLCCGNGEIAHDHGDGSGGIGVRHGVLLQAGVAFNGVAKGVNAGGGGDFGRERHGHAKVQHGHVRQQVGRDILLLYMPFGVGDHGHRSCLTAGPGGGGDGNEGNMPSGGEYLAAHKRFDVIGALSDDHPDTLGRINDAAAAYCDYAVTALLPKQSSNLVDNGHGAVPGGSP